MDSGYKMRGIWALRPHQSCLEPFQTLEGVPKAFPHPQNSLSRIRWLWQPTARLVHTLHIPLPTHLDMPKAPRARSGARHARVASVDSTSDVTTSAATVDAPAPIGVDEAGKPIYNPADWCVGMRV